MTMPTHQDAMLPILRALADGKAHARRSLADLVASHFGLTAEERAHLLPSGKAPVFFSRAGWALSYMKQAGLLTSPKRGWYAITDLGHAALATNPSRIDARWLMQYEGFRAFHARSRGDGDEVGSRDDGEEILPAIPPDEELERAYTRLRESVEAEVLNTIRGVSSSFFEQLVIDLLVRMGYGGNRAEAARAIGRSGDGGIDGVIDEDRLGLDSIYVQAKRWQDSVGRPEIQKFAGALQGQRATKGIFITTATFSKDAVEYAGRIGTRIVLIDGKRLAALMFEHDVGVSPKRSFVVKDLDGDYFEDANP